MAGYKSKDFSVLAYGNGFTLWHYKTADTLTQIKADAYFDDAADMVRAGDMILSNTSTGSTVVGALLLVQAVADGDVTIADIINPA